MARKEKQYHFIYKTTCLLNGKYYYGMHSTDNLNDEYYGSGRRLKRSLNKYGKENHSVEILEFLLDRKSLIKREKEVVNLNEIAKEDCMNIMVGGTGGFISDEQQRHRSICGGNAYAKKLNNDLEFRERHIKIVSENMKKNHQLGKIKYNTFTNKRHSEEAKLKISASRKGKGTNKDNSQYGTCWITKDDINKKIKKNEISKYLECGWILGRKLKFGSVV